jgi:hypothetical protein
VVKIATVALAVSLVLWVFVWLPKRLKRENGARFRYIVFSVLAVVFAVVLLKVFW